jgi:hypothetical protein
MRTSQHQKRVWFCGENTLVPGIYRRFAAISRQISISGEISISRENRKNPREGGSPQILEIW